LLNVKQGSSEYQLSVRLDDGIEPRSAWIKDGCDRRSGSELFYSRSVGAGPTLERIKESGKTENCANISRRSNFAMVVHCSSARERTALDFSRVLDSSFLGISAWPGNHRISRTMLEERQESKCVEKTMVQEKGLDTSTRGW